MNNKIYRIFKDGELVYKRPTVNESKEYCKKELETIYPETKRLSNPNKYLWLLKCRI